MHLVHNEQTKLTATWINTVAAAFIAAGAVSCRRHFLRIGRAASRAGSPDRIGRRLCDLRGRHTCGGARLPQEIARMSFETFALIWPFVVGVFVVATAFAIGWFEDRAERRKAR